MDRLAATRLANRGMRSPMLAAQATLFAAGAGLFACGFVLGFRFAVLPPNPRRRPAQPAARPAPPRRPPMSTEDIVAALIVAFAVMSLGNRGRPGK